MIRKQTAYFDEVHTGEGKGFILWVQEKGKDPIKAFEVKPGGDAQLNFRLTVDQITSKEIDDKILKLDEKIQKQLETLHKIENVLLSNYEDPTLEDVTNKLNALSLWTIDDLCDGRELISYINTWYKNHYNILVDEIRRLPEQIRQIKHKIGMDC